MLAQEAYYKFLVKINKGSTQFNATVDKTLFCSLFNEAQRKWLNKNTPESNSDEIANVQSIIFQHIAEPTNTQKEYVEFKLPEKWFANADVYVIADKEPCKDVRVNAYQVRSINVPKMLADEATIPSFEFQETFYTIEHDIVKVYKSDFTIKKLYMNYYKEPTNIEMEGGVNFDGTFMVDVNPELADIFVDQIISEAATEYMRNWENPQGVQLGKDRQDSEN